MNSISASEFQGWTMYHDNFDNFERHFALCEECSWSATIFKSRAQKSIINLGICPVCFNQDITHIPLAYVRLYNAYLNPRFREK